MKNQVDAHVGRRIRHRRWQMGETQIELSKKVGISYQLLLRYEVGAGRVSASLLWKIAHAQELKPSYYFEGLSIPQTSEVSAKIVDLGDIFRSKEAHSLLRMCHQIPATKRSRLTTLARVFSERETLNG